MGKSNILLRYSEGKFVDNYMMTIGINFMYKITKIDDLKIKMQIWDTAGQDKYKTITQNYYKNCNGAFVVFSIDSRESFYSVRINFINERKLDWRFGPGCPLNHTGHACGKQDGFIITKRSFLRIGKVIRQTVQHSVLVMQCQKRSIHRRGLLQVGQDDEGSEWTKELNDLKRG